MVRQHRRRFLKREQAVRLQRGPLELLPVEQPRRERNEKSPVVLDVKTDCIYNAVSAGKRIRDRSFVVNVSLYGLKLRIIRTKRAVSPIRMP